MSGSTITDTVNEWNLIYSHETLRMTAAHR